MNLIAVGLCILIGGAQIDTQIYGEYECKYEIEDSDNSNLNVSFITDNKTEVEYAC